MTRRRSLKRRVRARMKRTGESYTTARRHVTGRLEEESRPAEVTPASAQERRRWRRPVIIAAVGVALAGAVVAVIAVAGGGGGGDSANRYAATTPAPPSGLAHSRLSGSVEKVPCSEMVRAAQLAVDRPEKCFQLHPASLSEGSRQALSKKCTPPRLPERGCAFGFPTDQGEVVVRGDERPSERSLGLAKRPRGRSISR
jgi:hypothetical protein